MVSSSSVSRNIDHLPASLQSLVRQLLPERHLRPAEIRKRLLQAQVQAEDLAPWADFDHPVEDSYGRKLVFKGDNFEIMVMSWAPGDFSAIHDHGHTQWGAVQVFGPAEHATFRLQDGQLSTLARWRMEPGTAVGVSHHLIHQMGNPTEDQRFLSLHVYGEAEEVENVTGDARLLELEDRVIQRVDGGVFFALPPELVKREESEIDPDFPTYLRHLVELIRRLRQMETRGVNRSGKALDRLVERLFDPALHTGLLQFLADNTDAQHHLTHSANWQILNHELREAAKLQDQLLKAQERADSFHRYAALYDALIGQPSLEGFMAGYLRFFVEKTGLDLSDRRLLSLGCGTGLVEEFMIRELGIPRQQLFGLDISPAMVEVASRRIAAEPGDVLTLDPALGRWDVAFSGLNVFQYLDHHRLEEAVRKTAAVLQAGGWFVGDFITPDHIRWYPNVVYSADRKVISLRSPRLVERAGSMFQESEILNLSFLDGRMRVTYAGKHLRFLPPLHRIRSYFERYFTGGVSLYDAVSLQPIPEWADSCESTRYLVMARKGGAAARP